MSDRTHPDSGPVTPGKAGFTAADMATAAAQGFRDGVASVVAENTNTEREAFESALKKSLAAKHGETPEASDFVRDSYGEYENGFMEIAWSIWQARASLSLPAAGQEPVSPMAKMALALREKSAAERNDFDRRVQSGEWGAMPEPSTEADALPNHVAEVKGDDAIRILRWSNRVGAFDYPVGTKLYATPTQPAAPVAGQEPVAWQYRSRHDKGAWFDCTEERAKSRAEHPDKWDVRYLYAAPQPAVAAGSEPVALDHIACIEDGELRYMTGRKAPSYDCELYAMPGGKSAPPLYTHPSPPEGMAVTDAMIDAGKKMLHASNGRGAREKVERIFNAMLEAATSAGSGKGE